MGASSDDNRTQEGVTLDGRYRLEARLGRGGMATVYRATHVGTGRLLAVKRIDTRRVARERILAEARAAAAVRHPHLVEVVDVGEAGPDAMFVALELLDGETLAAHLDRVGRLEPSDALDVMIPILEALAALHERSIVHRDIKPSNIFLSIDGRGRVVPKLLDLGIARDLGSEEALTATGELLGTPAYMSPEQARGRAVDTATDVWACGAVLFECLAGRPLFEGDSPLELLHRIATERPAPVATRIDELPGGIARCIDEALAYDADARPADARALADALGDAGSEAGLLLSSLLPTGPRLDVQRSEPSPLEPASVDAPPSSSAPSDSASRRDESPARRWLPVFVAVAVVAVGGLVLAFREPSTPTPSTEDPAPAPAPVALSDAGPPAPTVVEAEPPESAPVEVEPAPPEPEPEPPAPTRRRRTPPAPRAATETTTEPSGEPAAPGIEEGPNGAPVIVD